MTSQSVQDALKAKGRRKDYLSVQCLVAFGREIIQSVYEMVAHGDSHDQRKGDILSRKLFYDVRCLDIMRTATKSWNSTKFSFRCLDVLARLVGVLSVCGAAACGT